MMRVYVCGPMRGKRLYNFPAFDNARDMINNMGHMPVSPADIDRDHGFDALEIVWPPGWDWNKVPDGLNLDDVIKRDIDAILTCQAYYTLDGWENSKGAKAEVALLEWRGCDRITLPKLIWGGAKERHNMADDMYRNLGKDEHDVASGTGVKHDQGKPRMSLVPQDALLATAEVFTFGAQKYADHNWAKGMRWCRLIDACQRHIAAFLNGEDTDKESGKSHLAHLSCDALMLLGLTIRNKGTDDRFKEG